MEKRIFNKKFIIINIFNPIKIDYIILYYIFNFRTYFYNFKIHFTIILQIYKIYGLKISIYFYVLIFY